MLDNRDYTLIIDKSGSMSTKDKPGGLSRWQIMQESALALANKCEELDPDGITFYLFSGKFKRYDNVTAAKVETIFQLLPRGVTRYIRRISGWGIAVIPSACRG
jgi:hypothetical protein